VVFSFFNWFIQFFYQFGFFGLISWSVFLNTPDDRYGILNLLEIFEVQILVILYMKEFFSPDTYFSIFFTAYPFFYTSKAHYST